MRSRSRQRLQLTVTFALLAPVVHSARGVSTAQVSTLATHSQVRRLIIHRTRQADSDLEVSGLLATLPVGALGYVSYAELASLPQTTLSVHDDENFATSMQPRGISIAGLPLEAVARALGALPGADMIDAICSDDYRAHYPASYVAAHHPLFGLRVEEQMPSSWAAKTHARDPGPYFMTHARFVAAFTVLAHQDQPQIPTGIVRLNFSTVAATYGAITPRGTHAKEAAVEDGFLIARQNCFRCHYQGVYGGTKSGRSWSALSTWAREQPAFFQNYVHNPQALEPHAHMPPFPQYDRLTLGALTAYFRTFTPDGPTHASSR